MQDKSKHSQANPVLEQALSHPRRLEMLDHLVRKKEVGTDETELAEALDLSTSRVGYHLLVLRSADLIAPVSDREQGRYVAASSAGP
ncbi:MAG TPA: helix-turn-helix domain-containing protein [Solirubrobacterales bacterium]|nr:helix-turn-helix domain-containing protein [Solirubrobacterales bacterium]